jgi:hypothetical protein
VKVLATYSDLILRSLPKAGVSKDGHEFAASWFETRRYATLLTMRGGSCAYG